jgi:hypothetical protein
MMNDAKPSQTMGGLGGTSSLGGGWDIEGWLGVMDDDQLRTVMYTLDDLLQKRHRALWQNCDLRPKTKGTGSVNTTPQYVGNPVGNVQLPAAPNSDPPLKPKFTQIQEAARLLLKEIVDNTPNCPDRHDALNCVREAVLWANSAIVLGAKAL